jgi:hypothetical protein
MKRDELEHVLRAAGAITGVSNWVIVGSQAILLDEEIAARIEERITRSHLIFGRHPLPAHFPHPNPPYVPISVRE